MENPHIWQWSPLRFCTTRRLQSHSTLEGVFSRFTLSVFPLSLFLCSFLSLKWGTHSITHTRAQKHAHINTHQSCFHLSSTPFSQHPAFFLSSVSLSLSFSQQHTCFQTVIRAAMVLQWSPLRKSLHLERSILPPTKKSSGTAALTKNRLGYNRKEHRRIQSVHPVVPFTCIRLSHCVSYSRRRIVEKCPYSSYDFAFLFIFNHKQRIILLLSGQVKLTS